MCTKIAASFTRAFAGAFAGALLLAAGSFAAQALPAAAVAADRDAGVTLVADGCGAGRHRDLDGVCRRDGEIVVAPFLPRIVVEPRVCPFGSHYSPRRGECVLN
jgi:hypothetical protein